MNEITNERRDYRLALGFLAGTAVGVGLMMWLAPRAAAELRQRATDTAIGLGSRAQGRASRRANGERREEQRVGFRWLTGARCQ